MRMSDHALLEEPQEEVDGFINLIFSTTLTEEQPRQAVGERRSATLYGIHRQAGALKKAIHGDRQNPAGAFGRQPQRPGGQARVGKHSWSTTKPQQAAAGAGAACGRAGRPRHLQFFNGQATTRFAGRRAFNRCLSAIAREVYPATPEYRSELVNKTNLSVPILTARKKLYPGAV
ncbi:MAG: hypothetical protein WKG07_26570 [Hymenobacter sp.]